MSLTWTDSNKQLLAWRVRDGGLILAWWLWRGRCDPGLPDAFSSLRGERRSAQRVSPRHSELKTRVLCGSLVIAKSSFPWGGPPRVRPPLPHLSRPESRGLHLWTCGGAEPGLEAGRAAPKGPQPSVVAHAESEHVSTKHAPLLSDLLYQHVAIQVGRASERIRSHPRDSRPPDRRSHAEISHTTLLKSGSSLCCYFLNLNGNVDETIQDTLSWSEIQYQSYIFSTDSL